MSFSLRVLAFAALCSFIPTTSAVSQETVPSLPVWTSEQGDRIREWLFQPATDISQPPDPAAWEPVKTPFLWTSGTSRVIKSATAPTTPGRAPAAWLKDAKTLSSYDNGWFERRIAVPQNWSGQRIWLKFDQVDCDAMLWVGDTSKPLYIEGPEARVDLTSLLKPGTETTLRVWVTRWWQGTPKTMADDPLRRLALEDWAGGKGRGLDAVRTTIPAGISDHVHFEVRPLAGEVEGIFAEPSFRKETLFTHVDALVTKDLEGGRIRVEILDPSAQAGQGRSVPSPLEVPLTIKDCGTQTVAIPWKNPRLWQLDDGYQYQLKVSLLDKAGKVVHAAEPVSFGYREIWVAGRDIMMNGRPVRLRLAPVIFPQYPSLLFWKGIGFNAMQWHPSPNSWFSSKGRRSLIIGKQDDPGMRSISPDVIEKANEQGVALIMPAPVVNMLRAGLTNPDAARAYKRETALWFKRLRNNPSIIMWMSSMNAGSFTREKPELIGTNPDKKNIVPGWYGITDAILSAEDPTRIVTHHCGMVGTVDYPNQYLNFMPLQERIEFPSQWAEKGDRPWGAIEHGTPYSANFSKWHGVPQYAEWHSIYFGDKAFEKEAPAYVEILDRVQERKAKKASKENAAPFAGQERARLGEVTAQYDFESLFTRETNRYWRAFGVAGGWKPWNFDTGLGISPQYKKGEFFYSELSEADAEASQKAAPSWVNPVYHAYRETMQPLLVFLGGPPDRFTAKDHAFFSGERFEKSLVAIWDGNEDKTISYTWTLTSGSDVLQKGGETLTLKPGDILKKPLAIQGPNVTKRTDARLTLTVHQTGAPDITDSLDLTFRPSKNVPETQSRWAIYDPQGKSAPWMKSLGINAVAVENREAFIKSGATVLVIGREAVESELPFTVQDVTDGLRVLVLEQKPIALESLGLRIQDIVTRNVYVRDKASPLLEGIHEGDLINWRGEATLLPRTSAGMKKWPLARPPHWGNYGAVASVVIETPQYGSFTSLADADFGLAYSALLEWRQGKGGILFSQFDLTDRVGMDPVATQIACNIIRTLDKPFPGDQNREIRYIGNTAGWDYIRQLGFSSEQYRAENLAALRPEKDILVIGPDSWSSLSGLQAQAGPLKTFVAAGGRVFVLPQKASEFTSASTSSASSLVALRTTRVRSSSVSQKAASAPILRGVGPQMLHWRTFLEQERFARDGVPEGAAVLLDGLVLGLPQGKGEWVFSQLDWTPLEDHSWNLEKSRWNVLKFYRQLLTNMGACNSDTLASRIVSPKIVAPLVNVPLWKIWNTVAKTKTASLGGTFPALKEPLPVEKDSPQAIAAAEKDKDTSPDVVATIGEGEIKTPGLEASKAGWRTYGPKGSNGFVYLDWISSAEVGKIGYARTYVYSSRPRQATFAVGGDYWMVFRVNGEAFVDYSKDKRPGNTPFAGEFRFTAPLKQGWNRLEAKVASGSSGFGFWCTLSDPGDAEFRAALGVPRDVPESKTARLLDEPDPNPKEVFYVRPLQPDDDPYRFNPW